MPGGGQSLATLATLDILGDWPLESASQRTIV